MIRHPSKEWRHFAWVVRRDFNGARIERVLLWALVLGLLIATAVVVGWNS